MTSRIASLDYLRGVAAISVAVPHFFVYRSVHTEVFEAISALGVEIFFVLSGYVLASQLLYVMSERRGSALGIFLVRRWMRTIPAYVVALCAISLLLGRVGDGDFFRYLFYAQNLVRQSNAEDYYAVAWSLSVEEWFYVVFPLVLLLATLASGRKHVPTVALVAAVTFIVGITLARLLFGDMENWGSSVRRVVFFRIDSIAFGFVLYLLLHDSRLPRLRELGSRWIVAALMACGAVSFWLVLRAAGGSDVAKHLFPFSAALFGASAIMIAVKFEDRLAALPRLAMIGVALGSFSYSIYLFHTIFLALVGSAFGTRWLAVQLAVYVVLVAVFAAAFYHSFEKPILSLRPSYRRGGPSKDHSPSMITAEQATGQSATAKV